MYLEHYGLLEKPFSLTPDPKFFFASSCHAEARDLLRYGVREREGFMCFVGAAGTGKTTLLRTVLEGFGDEVVTAMVLNPYLSETDLLRLILIDFGVVARSDFDSDEGRRLTKQDLISRLNRHLIQLSMQGKAAVLVIDEAQNLPLPVMEQIRLLSNLETSKSKLLQIVLAGQLGLRTLLATPELSQLAQRVSVRYTLQAFSNEDIRRYVDHRLRIAGSQGDIVFDADALGRVLYYSEGVPRLVNLICDRALLAGYAQQTREISAAIVDRAAETLDLARPGVAPPVEREAPELGSLAVPGAADATRRPFRMQIGHMVGGLALASSLVAGAVMLAPWMSASPGLQPAASPRAEGAQSLPVEGNGAVPSFGSATAGRASMDLARPSGEYTVYLSSFRRPDDAQLVDLRARLQQDGFTSYVLVADVQGQGRLHRLVAGDYADREIAAEAARRIERLGVAHVVVVSVAEVTGN